MGNLEQRPAPLTTEASIKLIVPFSFHESSKGRRQGSDMFTRAAQSVMDTTITKVVSADEDNEQTCWTEYDGDNPDYFLSHVQDFLFGSHLQARSPGDNELPSDYAVSVELDNDARQSFFPTESGATHYLDTRGKTNYDFPLQITNTRLFLFRS
ncbi:MAG: hypothetical protein ABEL51_08095, partial [Salinibacter sp.]